ncbi:molybdenum cofactor biosynthesis protein B [Haliangium ochraceum]|uniref:Molybdenum cofactor biosynthesis protein B n=1 Tax=Haliangium ochraceum (strain DSM 14365 / JCM 11303 / SMP-2) TaxID=502025 RepID=D0LQB7_HALO1|nr:molybdenum cofactor biosynthesis protein B [Haliangium ochraceum]ACY18926.1 molybdenum cofactor biosynthesis protein B [Haliangium ochraceum DSM 14365]
MSQPTDSSKESAKKSANDPAEAVASAASSAGASPAERAFIPVRVGVLAVSDTRTLESDRSGQTIASLLGEAGHEIAARTVVPDNRDAIRAQLSAWIADPGVDVIIATGGTGVTPRDVTPEAMAPLVTKPIPGFGELFRWLSYDEIGTSTIQSRAEAALCDETYVFLLPGSTGAVRTAMTRILLQQLDYRHRPCNFVELLPRIRNEREDGSTR